MSLTITFNRKKFVIIIAVILVAVVVLGAIGVSLLINPQNNESNPTATPTNTPTSTPNPTETATPSPTTQTSELLKATMTPASLGLLNGAKTDISVYVTYNGNPVTDAAVKFTSDNGGIFTTTEAQTTAGYYKTNFTAPNIETMTICTITATATAGVFGTQATVQITVTPTLTYSKIGSIQLLVTDQEGMPLGNAVVSSVVQPDGMGALICVRAE